MGMKKSIINIVYSIICLALAVAAFIVMINGTALHISVDPAAEHIRFSRVDYSCMEIAFGSRGYVSDYYKSEFYPSPWLSVEPFLLLLGAILILLTALGKLLQRRTCIVFSVISTLFFVGAGVLFFLNGQLFVLGNYFYQNQILEEVVMGYVSFEIGAGAITAGILSFIAAAFTAVKSVLTIVKAL